MLGEKVPVNRTPIHSQAGVKGPKGWPLLGNLDIFLGDKIETFYATFRKYGGIVPLSLGGQPIFLVNEPDAVKHILQDNNRNYKKGMGFDNIEPFVGKGLLTSEGDFWRQQRRLAQPAFHRKRIANLADIMLSATGQMLKRWEIERGTFDVAHEMMRLTLDIVSRTLFSTALRPEEFETIDRILPPLLIEADKRANDPIGMREKLLIPAARAFDRNVAALNKIVFRIIEERRASGVTGDDLLGMLMEAQDEETGASMGDQQLRDEVMTILLAGHETTALNMIWTVYLLGQHMDVLQQVEAEIDAVFEAQPVTADGLRSLPYTTAVIQESLRLFPPAWAITRQALANDLICGVPIPAKAMIMISSYVVHRHPDHWEAPEEFMPERFLDPHLRRHRFAYMPFGGGPRMCIGSHYAQMEAMIILTMIVQKYRLILQNGLPPEKEAAITLRPKNGLWVNKIPR